MTAATLLSYISAGLSVQLVAAVGVAFWRHGRRRRAASIPIATTRASRAAWDGWRDFRVARRVFEDAAQTQCSFYLEPLDGRALPSFEPGQYLTFRLQIPDRGGDGDDGTRTATRCYSLSDRPDPNRYRVTIKRIGSPRAELPPGVCSNHFHDALQVGTIVAARAPAGRFVVVEESTPSTVLVAGGIGITPLMSMLRSGLATRPDHQVHLYYGTRNGAEHAFRQELEELAQRHRNLHVNVVYSRPQPDDRPGTDFQYHGHVDIELLRRTLPIGRHRFYVCGPPPMMASLIPALISWGVPEPDLHYEAFGPASAPTSDEKGLGESPSLEALQVHFRASGRTLSWDGAERNLLDLAERHGVSVSSGCRSGSCGSCEVRVLSGRVRYAQQPDYDMAPDGCLLCVAAPESALELDA